jgi:hypothetical protein
LLAPYDLRIASSTKDGQLTEKMTEHFQFRYCIKILHLSNTRFFFERCCGRDLLHTLGFTDRQSHLHDYCDDLVHLSPFSINLTHLLPFHDNKLSLILSIFGLHLPFYLDVYRAGVVHLSVSPHVLSLEHRHILLLSVSFGFHLH